MKQIFRCEYCDKMGTEEDILKHEEECIYNYTKRACYTCKNAENKVFKYSCKLGKEIPEGKIYIGCDKYEWDEEDHAHKDPVKFNNLFGGIFG